MLDTQYFCKQLLRYAPCTNAPCSDLSKVCSESNVFLELHTCAYSFSRNKRTSHPDAVREDFGILFTFCSC